MSSNSMLRTGLILLGVAAVAYGIFATYSLPEMQLYRAAEYWSAAFGGRTPSLVDQFKVFFVLYFRAPYPYVGLALLLLGLSIRERKSRSIASYEVPTNLYRNCLRCGGPVLESAPFCPHCGQSR